MARCLTITLNASVDRTYVIDRLRPGGVTRAVRTRAMPGGKGNNVARVLNTLGHEVVATGFLGGEPGRFIDRELRAAGITTDFTWIAGDSRSCLTFIEQETGTVTEVLEPGPVVSAAEAAALLAALPALAADAAAVVVSGSVPAGLPEGMFGELLRILRSSDAYLAADTSGDPLRQALDAGVDLIAPNTTELAAVSECSMDAEALVAYARERVRHAARPLSILLTRGADGAVLISGDRCITARPPALVPVNPVGSGDALLAGFIAARMRQAPACEALAAAVAAGSAAALEEVAGAVVPEQVARVRAGVTLRTWADDASC